MSSSTVSSRAPRLTAVPRESERVTPLELFFDLVFVLALTQCTRLIAGRLTWEAGLEGLLVLGMLWWSWVGYAWLTSTVDPEEGSVRLVMFAAMAAFLVAALCVPQAFAGKALLFACAYIVVRAAHIALYLLASREDPELRHAVTGLAASSAVGAGLLVVAAFTGGGVQLGIWGLALLLDTAGPFLAGGEGWTLVPGHFVERHGAIVIIALGESIVAIGAGDRVGFGAGVVAAAILGVTVAAAMWWVYFDVVAPVAARRLAQQPEGRERNEMARDSYSYLHFPMIAGIVLVAVGMEQTLAHVGRPLGDVASTAMLGGAALYLLALVAFRYRNIHTLNPQRLLCASLLLGLLVLDLAVRPAALVTLGVLAAVLTALVGYEVFRFAEARDRVRHPKG
ncbi:MAG TPA: low temperature requirement protein A [Solirubrobacteraceae bacterium]|nr:low temperature requirement protein A [Solirubrobacteraceae bacterium]